MAQFVWEKGRKNDAKLVSVGHDYIFVYARSLQTLKDNKTVWREEKPGAKEIWDQYLILKEKHGNNLTAIETALQAWYLTLGDKHPAKRLSRYRHIDKFGPWRDDNISWPGGGGPRYDVIHPVTKMPCAVPERGWVYSTPEKMQEKIALGVVEFRGDHTEPPIKKAHIRPIAEELDDEAEGDTDSGTEAEDELASQVRGNYFYKQSQVSVKYLRGLMGAKVFNNPKDHVELQRLIDYVTSSDREAIILDFFAGSGATGHAVLDLNNRDNGDRKFILVQLPEPLDPADKDQKIALISATQLAAPVVFQKSLKNACVVSFRSSMTRMLANLI